MQKLSENAHPSVQMLQGHQYIIGYLTQLDKKINNENCSNCLTYLTLKRYNTQRTYAEGIGSLL